MRSDENMNEYNIFGAKYPLLRVGDGNPTKESIIFNSTLLFAKNGFSTVTIRDIAASIGIKPASLYNHFDSKETLWKAVLEHAKTLYLLYFEHLDNELAKVESFAEVLDIMFREPEQLTNVFTCYAFSMIGAEQFRDENAAEVFNDTLLRYSIEFIKGWLNKCVERGFAPEFDTGTVASLIMHSVLISLNVKVQGDMGRATPYDPSRMLVDLHRFILEIVESRRGEAAEESAPDTVS